MPHPNSDPAEGSREVIDHELARAGARRASVKNPENEAQNPGGVPTEAIKGSSPGQSHDPEGQQGSTDRGDH
ncbi:MAG TPA: hypothetical protein VIG39_12960 [Rhizomicrobium sp.]